MKGFYLWTLVVGQRGKTSTGCRTYNGCEQVWHQAPWREEMKEKQKALHPKHRAALGPACLARNVSYPVLGLCGVSMRRRELGSECELIQAMWFEEIKKKINKRECPHGSSSQLFHWRPPKQKYSSRRQSERI